MKKLPSWPMKIVFKENIHNCINSLYPNNDLPKECSSSNIQGGWQG